MPQKIQTLIRLNASAYHGQDFFQKEELMARAHGLQYFSSLKNFSQVRKFSGNQDIALISNTHTVVNDLPQELLANTGLWIHSNSGYDNFDVNFVKDSHFPIVLGNPIRSPAVSEYILANLFNNYGLCSHQEEWDRSRKWDRALLADQKILICGAGLIGSTLEKSLTPLCKNISIYDPFKKKNLASSLVAHIQAFAQPDIILLAASLNTSSRHLINKEVLSLLGPNFLIINAARGPLIDQAALLASLRRSPNARAILDVFEVEPPPPEVGSLENLKKTSHIAGVSKNLDNLIISFENEVINNFLNMSSPEEFGRIYQNLNLKNRFSLNGKELI